MAHPITLRGASKREAIVDAIYRVVIGFDVDDWALCESAFIKDHASVVFEMAGRHAITGVNTFKELLFLPVAKLDTLHCVSNVRIDEQGVADGLEKAYVTAYVMAQHYRTGDGVKGDAAHLMAGSQYFVDVEKPVDEEDGMWRIRRFGFKIMWRDGDRSITGR